MIYDSYDFIHGDIIEILAELCTDSMVSGCFGGGSIRDVVVRCHESSRVLLSNVIHADHLRTAIDKGWGWLCRRLAMCSLLQGEWCSWKS